MGYGREMRKRVICKLHVRSEFRATQLFLSLFDTIYCRGIRFIKFHFFFFFEIFFSEFKLLHLYWWISCRWPGICRLWSDSLFDSRRLLGSWVAMAKPEKAHGLKAGWQPIFENHLDVWIMFFSSKSRKFSRILYLC